MTLVNATELVNNAFAVGDSTEFRQLSGGQLAVAGVAIAVISMILEFIAMSGFAPKVKITKKMSHFQMFEFSRQNVVK